LNIKTEYGTENVEYIIENWIWNWTWDCKIW